MNRFSLFASAALVALSSAAAHAQTCQGYTPFSVAPLRVTGDLTFGDHATSYGASFGAGQSQPGLFGGVSVAGTKLDGVDESAKSFGFFGGLSVPVKSIPGLEFCPVADFTHINYPGDFSGNNFTIGGALGRTLVASPTVNVVPFADLRLLHASISASGGGSASDNSGQLGLGAGIVFSKTVTLRPVVVIPIAQDGASTLFAVSIGWNFGK